MENSIRIKCNSIRIPAPSLNILKLGVVAALSACGGGGGGGSSSSEANITPAVTNFVAQTACSAGQNLASAVNPDPLYPASWHLKNTGATQTVSALTNAQAVSGIDANTECVHNNGSGFTGRGVTIAIVDSGLEIGHEDLAPNVSPGNSFNFFNSTSDPSPAPNQDRINHGTGVAGIAAARGWNGVGSRGTAPNASMVGYNLINTFTAAQLNGLSYAQINALSLGSWMDPTFRATLPTSGATFGGRANNVSIFNMSYGRDIGAPIANPTALSTNAAAAQLGTTSLRNGLGAVYLQSAGNSFQKGDNFFIPGTQSQMAIDCSAFRGPATVAELGTFSNPQNLTCGSPSQDANGTNNPCIYLIAALNNAGVASSYSSAGAGLWISGFGGEFGAGNRAAAIVTTDNSTCSSGSNNTTATAYNRFVNALPGPLEQITNQLFQFAADSFGIATVLGNVDPNCNYTGQFNGTSAAAPSVSGVVALMLEANPNLTWQDVGYILARTAKKVDGNQLATSITLPGQPFAYTLVDPWITNAAGFNFHNRYGFGMVDAAGAVALARNYTPPADRRAAAVSSSTFSSLGANTTIGPGTGVRYNSAHVLLGSNTQRTGSIVLDVVVGNRSGPGNNLNPGKLQFELTSPNGTKSILMPAYTSWYRGSGSSPGAQSLISDGGSQAFRFMTNAFYGETMGSYTVRVVELSGFSTTRIELSGVRLTSYSM